MVDQSEALIDAKYRIDLDKLKHLMTICDLEKIQSNCEGRIHAVFNARKGLNGSRKYIGSHIRTSLLKPHKDICVINGGSGK